MRLSLIALLSIAAAAVSLQGQDYGRDRPGTGIERKDHGRGHDREAIGGQGHGPGREVVVDQHRPGREVIVERQGSGRGVVVERRVPARTVVVQRAVPPAAEFRYGYHDGPREWRKLHPHEYAAHAYYSEHDRLILQSYCRRIPPKHLRRLHPEWRDRIVLGRPVPPDVVVIPVEVERQLPPLPKGYVRFQVGSSFFIKDVRTGIVIDALF